MSRKSSGTAPPVINGQSLEAEKTVIGSCLIDSSCFGMIRHLLRKDDFFSDSHAMIWEAMENLADNGMAIDILTVSDKLGQQINQIGDGVLRGTAYLTALVNRVPTSQHAEHYAMIVKRYSLRRAIAAHCSKVVMNTAIMDDPHAIISSAIDGLVSIARSSPTSGIDMPGAVDEFAVLLASWLENKRDVWGMKSGLIDLDNLLGGFDKGQFYVIAARPNMGKSSLALQLAYEFASANNHVVFFSLEMPISALLLRLVSLDTMINSMDIKRGNLTTEQIESVWQAMEKIRQLSITWFAKSMDIAQIKAELTRLQAVGKAPACVIVDYLQLVGADGENQNIRIGKVSAGLKSIAQELNCCVIGVSQLNRAIEARANATPQLSDLRDSGTLEQDADVVIFIHKAKDNDYSLIVAKNRNGPNQTGIRGVVFLPQFTRFVNKADIPF